jgi:hypothetical protein
LERLLVMCRFESVRKRDGIGNVNSQSEVNREICAELIT